MKTTHMLVLLGAIAVAMPATVLADYKKPNVKDLQSAVSFDINAEMRDNAWDLFAVSPAVAVEAVGYFNAHYAEKTEDEAELEAGADATMSHYYVVTENGTTVREGVTAEPSTGEPEPAHNTEEPKPGTEVSEKFEQISVKTKGCDRRCRGGQCFGKELTVLDVADVSDEVMQALQADPFLQVDIVADVQEAV